MPKYSSKTQSKNGGRRKKQTKRKLRRARKSRKVMRGGGGVMSDETGFNKVFANAPHLKTELLAFFPTNNISNVIAEIRGNYKSIHTKQFLERPEVTSPSDELRTFLSS